MPDWFGEIRAILQGLELEPTRESEIVEEVGQHLKDRYEELVAGGATPEVAHRAVMAEVGDGRWGAQLRSRRSPARPPAPGGDESGTFLAALWQDLRHAGRVLAWNPGFAAIAILSLALGIGANTAIFQLLDAVRLRTLPVKDPRRLAEVRIAQTPNGRRGSFTGHNPQLTYALWEQIHDQQRAFTSLGAWSANRANLSRGGEARYAEVLWVSGDFFNALGLQPALGRLLSNNDDRPGCGSPGIVLSDSFWRREFGAVESVLGKKVSLEGRPFEIVGATPRNFFGPEVGRGFDVALPLCAEPLLTGEKPRIADRQAWWLSATGRLKPGWTPAQASAQLAAISRGVFEATLPSQYDPTAGKHYLDSRLEALPAAFGVSTLRRRYEEPLWLLLAAAGFVLLIACANLANLTVARATSRQREMAVRLALGASRGRLIRQLLAESLLLSLIGTVCGAGLAQALSRGLVSFLRTQTTRWSLDLTPDAGLFAFTAALAALTCVLFGLAPAIQAARISPGEAMKSSGRGVTAGRQRLSLRRILVVTQVALSLVLLVGALLFVGTLRNLQSLDAGFRPDHVLVTDIDLSPLKIPPESRAFYKRGLIALLEQIPGVVSVAGATIVPVSGDGWNENVRILGSDVELKQTNFNRVGSAYFRTLGTPLLAGRDFSGADTTSSPPVAIVTETFARDFLGGASPLGRSLAVGQQGGRPDRIYQIVGLVRDSKYGDLREDFSPIVFLAQTQDDDPGLDLTVLLRSNQPTAELIASVGRAVSEASPAIVLQFRIFDLMIRDDLLRERLLATLSGFFGFLAAILAMIGLYGVISYTVERRRNEIGVRMALGASGRDVLAMILREAAVLLAFGLAIGTVLALLAATTARTLLFGLQPSDPLSIALAVGGLAAVAGGASFFPAWRAASLDPMIALRDE